MPKWKTPKLQVTRFCNNQSKTSFVPLAFHAKKTIQEENTPSEKSASACHDNEDNDHPVNMIKSKYQYAKQKQIEKCTSVKADPFEAGISSYIPDSFTCVFCETDCEEIQKCSDCGTQFLACESCMKKEHVHRPLHNIKKWQNGRFHSDEKVTRVLNSGTCSCQRLPHSISGVSSTVKKRVEFTPNEKEVLMQSGLISCKGLDAKRKIKEMAEELHISEKRIKNWIYTRKCNAKPSTSKQIIPKKLTPWNIFSSDYMKKEKDEHDFKSVVQQCAESWKKVKEDESEYSKIVDQCQKQNAAATEAKKALSPEQQWKYTQALVKKMDKLAQEFDDIGVEMFAIGMAKQKNRIFVTGTQTSMNFVTSEMESQYAQYISGSLPNKEETDLRQSVQEMFNMKYSAAIGKKGRIPYKTIDEDTKKMQALGFPGNLELKRPSSYTKEELQQIMSAQDKIAFLCTTGIFLDVENTPSVKTPSSMTPSLKAPVGRTEEAAIPIHNENDGMMIDSENDGMMNDNENGIAESARRMFDDIGIQPEEKEILYEVEKVLRKKKRVVLNPATNKKEKKDMLFVKWVNYNSRYNSWIDSQELVLN